jgi:hypothetical protein
MSQQVACDAGMAVGGGRIQSAPELASAGVGVGASFRTEFYYTQVATSRRRLKRRSVTTASHVDMESPLRAKEGC